MLFFVRTSAGLGDTVVYARLRDNTGQYWDFVALSWIPVINNDCKIFLAENADGDPLESLYMAEAVIPASGPWIEEAVLESDGSVLAFDNNVMGELDSIPTSASTLHEKLEFIFQYLAGKRTATSALETMLKDDGATALGTAVLSDNGTTFTKNKVQ